MTGDILARDEEKKKRYREIKSMENKSQTETSVFAILLTFHAQTDNNNK